MTVPIESQSNGNSAKTTSPDSKKMKTNSFMKYISGQADDTDAYDTDAYDIADKQTTQTAARRIGQGYETQTTSQKSRRHRRRREELVQGYESLQSKDLNSKIRGHNLYD
jgi:hypothetical protein